MRVVELHVWVMAPTAPPVPPTVAGRGGGGVPKVIAQSRQWRINGPDATAYGPTQVVSCCLNARPSYAERHIVVAV